MKEQIVEILKKYGRNLLRADFSNAADEILQLLSTQADYRRVDASVRLPEEKGFYFVIPNYDDGDFIWFEPTQDDILNWKQDVIYWLEPTPPTEDKEVEPPPDTSIFSKIELSVTEMCGISIQELKSGRKYGQIPTAKQLIVRILTELEYKPGTILENMPYMSTTQSIRSRYYASIKYEKYDKRFRIVLNQLKDIYLK